MEDHAEKEREVAQEMRISFEEELHFYRGLLIANPGEGKRRLDCLSQEHPEQFEAVCYRLLDDPSAEIQKSAFLLLALRGKRPDLFVEARALQALAFPALYNAAAHALGRLGTSTPTTIQLLFLYAQKGSPQAISALRRLVVTEEDRSKLLQIARQSLISPDDDLRGASLLVLVQYSRIEEEEAHLLQAAQRCYDEQILGVLGSASPRVLPALEKLLATVPDVCAEYKDINRAIEQIKQRMKNA